RLLASEEGVETESALIAQVSLPASGTFSFGVQKRGRAELAYPSEGFTRCSFLGAVVEKRLAACVNLIPQITSIYEWKGELEEDNEVLMMIKTRSSLVPALTDYVRSVHPYEVAEVIALPVEQGNSPYLHWVHQVTESVADSSTVLP
uniref:CutA divalent cation tolerance homolog n=1 Tax=Felis catus TaxID=9685 RepID=A0ABI8AFD0_FELCA